MIDFTKPVRTKGGASVRILSTEGPSPAHPIIGVIDSNQNVDFWSSDGTYALSDIGLRHLENAPEEVVRYIGIEGSEGTLGIFKNTDAVLKHGFPQSIKCTFIDEKLTHVEIVKD